MSNNDATDIILKLRKSRIEFIVGILSILTIIFVCFIAVSNFYYNTNNGIEELHREFKELKDQMLRHEVSMQSKISREEMLEWKHAFSKQMEGMDTKLNILIEKK